MLTQDEIGRITSMKARGLSITFVARELGVSRQTVHAHLRPQRPKKPRAAPKTHHGMAKLNARQRLALSRQLKKGQPPKLKWPPALKRELRQRKRRNGALSLPFVWCAQTLRARLQLHYPNCYEAHASDATLIALLRDLGLVQYWKGCWGIDDDQVRQRWFQYCGIAGFKPSFPQAN